MSFTDRANLPFKAYVKVVTRKKAGCSFYIYAHGCILNKTEYKLVFYYSSATRGQLVAGQLAEYEALMISKRPNIRVGIDFNNASGQLPISSAGITTAFEIERLESNGLLKAYQFILNTSLSLVVQDEYIYTKIITIAPYFVFYNISDMYLEIIQEEFDLSLLINPNEARPWHWPDASKPRLVLIRLGNTPNDFSEWNWSTPIELNDYGITTVNCRHKRRKRNYLMIKITRTVVEGTIVTEIQKEFEEDPIYRLENYSKYFSMQYWQKGKDTDKEYLNILSQVSFGWIDYNSPRVLQVKFYYGALNSCPVDIMSEEVHEFSLDQLDQRKEIKVSLTKKVGHIIYVSTVTDGYTKILKVSDVQSAFDMNTKDEKLKYNYFLNVVFEVMW